MPVLLCMLCTPKKIAQRYVTCAVYTLGARLVAQLCFLSDALDRSCFQCFRKKIICWYLMV